MIFESHPGTNFHQRSKAWLKSIIEQSHVIYTRVKIIIVNPIICREIPSTHNNECHKDIKSSEMFAICK